MASGCVPGSRGRRAGSEGEKQITTKAGIRVA